jgi:hypothetical protein
MSSDRYRHIMIDSDIPNSHSPAPDIVFTVLWLLVGVLVPLMVLPRVLQQVAARRPPTDGHIGD